MDFSFEAIEKGGIGGWDHDAVRVTRSRDDMCYMVIGTPAVRRLNSTNFNVSYDRTNKAIKLDPSEYGWKFGADEVGRLHSSKSARFQFPVGDYVPVPGHDTVFVLKGA